MDTIELKWDLLGAKLANLSDVEQAAFYKGLAMEFANYESEYKAQLQLSFVNNRLDSKVKKVLEKLLPMLWLKDNGK